ncbi:MAG: hypothetical protein JXA96_09655 [Sedimentisphaerales bacterium]|nr:hypothetical protein [Sedimentisphaerales bacterium]
MVKRSSNYPKKIKSASLTCCRLIITTVLLVAGFMMPRSAIAMQNAVENPTSIFDIVRQEMTQKNELHMEPEGPNNPDQPVKSIQPDIPAEPSVSAEALKNFETDETLTGEHILHFPKARSLGRLEIGDENIKTDLPYPFEEINWEYFGNAQGNVTIPQDKIVHLILNSWTWQNPTNLSALEQLKPDDIYSLTLSPSWSVGDKFPNDKCLSYVLHLSGLKTLNLDRANITSKGLESLAGLKSLERLCLPANVYDSGIAAVGNIKTLTLLSISEGNSLTDAGLRHLENLKSLKTLLINSVKITDEGLKALSSLSSLNHLVLRGNFTNDAALYLKDVSSLKTLKIDPGQFSDTGMKNISNLTQLESLYIHWLKEITDEGVSYLKNIPNLKKLDIGNAKLTDKAMLDITQIQSLESLYLPPYGISDKGMKNISELENLKFLSVCRGGKELTDESLSYIGQLNIETLQIGGAAFSDEGMKNIAKLTNLKDLSIFFANQLSDKGLVELAALQSLSSLYIGEGTKVSVSGLKSLNTLKNLKKLDLNMIHEGKSDIMDISGLTELENLTLYLYIERQRDGSYLNAAQFSDQDWACLAKLRKLKTLNITGFGITDNGIKYLSGLKNLEQISITCSNELSITDEGLKYIIDKPKLNRIFIKDGHFTDKALEYLSGMPTLSWLELTSDFAFSNKAIKNFQANNPNIVHFQLMP